jgi:hypothetical protein
VGEGRISTSRSGRRRGLLVTGIGAAVGLGLLLMPGAANAATTSSSSSQTHTLQALTGGTVDKFDPSLGTLTRVDWTTEVSVTTELCAENLSTAAGAVPSGTTEAEVTVNFPAGTATTASVSGTVPPVSLSVSNGSDDCLGALVLGNDAAGQPPTFPGGASGSDVYFNADTDNQTGSGSITDPAGLAAFVGPGTLPYTVDQSSEGDVLQSSEWDITFLAHGSTTVTVTYTYEGTSSSTTTVPGATTTTVPGTLPRTR